MGRQLSALYTPRCRADVCRDNSRSRGIRRSYVNVAIDDTRYSYGDISALLIRDGYGHSQHTTSKKVNGNGGLTQWHWHHKARDESVTHGNMSPSSHE